MKRATAVSLLKGPWANLAGVLLALASAWVCMGAVTVLAEAAHHQDQSQISDPLANFDPDLQGALEQLVRDLGLLKAVESRKLALGLADITKIDAPRYAALNPDHMMYAASLPKIAILLGAFVEIGEGELTLDPGLRDEMVRMIRYSDNASSNRVLAQVGREDLIEILTSDRFRLYDPTHNGGLWVGKDYAGRAAYRRDPLHNLSHGANVYEVIRFFYLLEQGKLVDARYRDEMKQILSKPGISHKFVAGLKDRPGVKLYRKSGTWRDFHADSALVEAGQHRFIMVGLAHHPQGGEWLERLAAPMHDLVVPRTAGSGDSDQSAAGQ